MDCSGFLSIEEMAKIIFSDATEEEFSELLTFMRKVHGNSPPYTDRSKIFRYFCLLDQDMDGYLTQSEIESAKRVWPETAELCAGSFDNFYACFQRRGDA